MKTRKTLLMATGAVLFLLGSLAMADEGKGDPERDAGFDKPAVKPESKGPAEPGGWILALAWRLDLTKEQVAQIQAIVEEAQAEAQEAAEVVAAAQAVLHEAVVKGASEEDIRVAAAAMGIVIGDQAVLRAQTLAAIKAVLTEEQFGRFDAIKTKLPELRQLLQNRKAREADVKSPKSQDKTSKDPGDAGGKTPAKGKGDAGGKTLAKGTKDAGDKTPTADAALAMVTIFKAADTNKDGALTMDELNAYLKSTKGDPSAPKK